MATRKAPEVLTVAAASNLPLTGGHSRDRTADAAGSSNCLIAVEPQQFQLTWPLLQLPPGDGLVAIARQAEATLGWADALLARDGSDLYVWAALDGEPVRHALDLLDRPGVVAATVAWDHADPRHVSLALEVAARLASRRANLRGPPSTTASLTMWSPPAPPPGSLRVPHQVKVLRGGTETDAVLWELMPAGALQEWLGGHPMGHAAAPRKWKGVHL